MRVCHVSPHLPPDQAANALGQTKDPRAYDALIKLTKTPSWHGRIQIAGLTGLGELGDKRSFEAGYKVATDKSQPTNIRTAALVVVGATGKGDPRAYPLIQQQFDAAKASGSIQGMINAMFAVIKIADPRGQVIFDDLKARFKDNPGAMGFISTQEAQFKAAIAKP